jgi:hypothetical protein
MLTFRKTHPHIEDDYQVIHDGVSVGSIKRRNAGSQVEKWDWEIYLFGRVVEGNSGSEDTGEHASAALRAAWERSVTLADLQWIRKRAEPMKKPRHSDG